MSEVTTQPPDDRYRATVEDPSEIEIPEGNPFRPLHQRVSDGDVPPQLRSRPGLGATVLNVVCAVFALSILRDSFVFGRMGLSLHALPRPFVLSIASAALLVIVMLPGHRLRRELRHLGYPRISTRTAVCMSWDYSREVVRLLPRWEQVATSPLVRPDDPDTTLYALLDALRDSREIH